MQKTLVWRSQKNEGKIFLRGCVEKHGDRQLFITWPYTRIGEEALKNNIRIKEVVLAACVKEIGQESFSGCTRARTVSCESVVRIGNQAFSGCVNLRNFLIPKTAEYMGKGIFSECKRLQQVIFEEGSKLIRIPEKSFMECRELAEIILPKQIETIGRQAFYRCVSLGKIEIPKAVKKIEKEAFYQTGLKTLELPEGLQFIGESAFLKCKELEYVRIPEHVDAVEKWAFHGCNLLKTVEFSGDPDILGEWIINRGTKILCRRDTRVDDYCRKNGFAVEYL